MKLFTARIFFIFCLIANRAFSSEKEAPIVEPQDQTRPTKKVNTSLDNRQNKKYQLSVGVGNEYSMAAFTFSAGYFIDPSQVITFRYSEINQDQEYEAVSNELHKMKAYTLGYKKFLGNSFNVQPTLYYRRSSTDFVHEGTVKSVGTPNLVYDDMGVGVRIGNEWQWDKFVMGVDWIGMNETIHKINSQKIWQGLPQATHYKTETTFTVVSAYLGASF
ncbi:MAG: hypothetical protein ACXVLQ_18060 [Bacteriovorax sp.]